MEVFLLLLAALLCLLLAAGDAGFDGVIVAGDLFGGSCLLYRLLLLLLHLLGLAPDHEFGPDDLNALRARRFAQGVADLAGRHHYRFQHAAFHQLMDIEQRANETVRADIPVRVWFPDAQERSHLEYRSKLELTENVRIVEIGDVDRCACCAPHVSRTGEVGVIKILDCQRHRGGVRVSVVCGMDAVEDYRAVQTGVTAVSRALSAKRGEVAAAVGRVLDENTRLKERAAALSAELVRVKAESAAATDGNICVFDGILDEIAQRELTNLLMEKCGGIAAVFSGSDKDGWRYIIGSKTVDLRRETRRINAAINGRGGGTERMIQGRALAEKGYITSEILSLKFDC